MGRFFTSIIAISLAFSVASCGTLTGIPGHGGGKRFAVEQELLASTAKAVARDLPVDELIGQRVAIFFIGIGDQGTGNIIGGRYSIAALLRGGYLATAPSETFNEFPEIVRSTTSTSNSTTTTGATSTTSNSTSNSDTNDFIDSPKYSRTEREGDEFASNLGIEYNGIGVYQSSAVENPRDYAYLSGVIQKELVIKGVKIVDNEQADYDLFVTVDVFGTIRSRHDWHIANQESLTAKTSIEIAAIEKSTGRVVIPPQSTSYEAEYNEQYVAWAGPIHTMKELRLSDGILSDAIPVKVNYPTVPLANPSARLKAASVEE